MTRSAHTYRLGDLEVVLTVPEGVRVPRLLPLRAGYADSEAVFEHFGVKTVRSRPTTKTKPVNATQIPDDFAASDEMRAWAAVNVPSIDVDVMTPEFVTYWQGLGRPMKDWVATWRNGMLKRHRWNVESGWKPTARPTAKAVTAAEQRAKWIRKHGLTEDEYEANKGDEAWLEMVKRRGVVA